MFSSHSCHPSIFHASPINDSNYCELLVTETSAAKSTINNNHNPATDENNNNPYSCMKPIFIAHQQQQQQQQQYRTTGDPSPTKPDSFLSKLCHIKMRIAFIVTLSLLLLFVVSVLSEDTQTTPEIKESFSVGYVALESAEKAKEIADQLVSGKLAANVLVVPGVNSLRGSEGSNDVKQAPSHVLLIETRDELIKNVKAAIEEVYKGINVPQVLFSSVTNGTPSYFDLINSSKVKAAAGTIAVPLRKREVPIDILEEEEDAVAKVEEEAAKEEEAEAESGQPSPTQKTIYLDASSEFQVKAAVGETVILLVQGNPSTGYLWGVDETASSPSLQHGSFNPVSPAGAGGTQMLVGAPTLFSLKVVPTESGNATLTLRYARPWDPTDDPSVKVVNFTVA